MTSLTEAQENLLAVHMHYAQRGQNLAGAALMGAKSFVSWVHYPLSDVKDIQHRSRFYYHAHDAQDMVTGEHGHFHVFVDPQNRLDGQGLLHVVGISLNGFGEPIRLFTTNQWVTGEAFQPANQMSEWVDKFCIQTKGRLAPLGRWLTALVALYKQEIVQLLKERDRVLQAHPQGLTQALADRSLHFTSQHKLADYWKRLERVCLV
jgi:hypothetical protein